MDKTIIACTGSASDYTFPIPGTVPGGLPAWLTISTYGRDFPIPVVMGTVIEITAEAVSGTYTYDMGDWTLTIIVNATCFASWNNCCDPQINIAWLNTAGWQNYPFNALITDEIRSEGAAGVTYTKGLELRYAKRADKYNGMIVYSGDIPKAHADMLDSLKNSIQAYMLNSETGQFDIPIILDEESYVKYKSSDKFWTVSARFRLSKRRNIQTQ